MEYKKNILNGYIAMCGDFSNGIPISDSEYREICDAFKSRPTAPTGYTHKLRADTLEWELVELPPVEPTDEEATESDYISALESLGVNLNDEE